MRPLLLGHTQGDHCTTADGENESHDGSPIVGAELAKQNSSCIAAEGNADGGDGKTDADDGDGDVSLGLIESRVERRWCCVGHGVLSGEDEPVDCLAGGGRRGRGGLRIVDRRS